LKRRGAIVRSEPAAAFSAEPVQLAPPAGPEHLDDRRRDAPPDVGQGDQSVDPLPIEDLLEIPRLVYDGVSCPPVGGHSERVRPLLGEEVGRLAEPVRDLLAQA
jgi:hypothetical protein